ncbi:hypothetical protein MHYP_G00193850 [Metynnis hypsauchen]
MSEHWQIKECTELPNVPPCDSSDWILALVGRALREGPLYCSGVRPATAGQPQYFTNRTSTAICGDHGPPYNRCLCISLDKLASWQATFPGFLPLRDANREPELHLPRLGRVKARNRANKGVTCAFPVLGLAGLLGALLRWFRAVHAQVYADRPKSSVDAVRDRGALSRSLSSHLRSALRCVCVTNAKPGQPETPCGEDDGRLALDSVEYAE